jgi:hypothetical protein
MKRALPSSRARSTAGGVNKKKIYGLVMVLIVAVIVFKLVLSRETDYEHIAHSVTVAIEANDLEAVAHYQNAETATHLNRARIGRAADAFAPLGRVRSVHQLDFDPQTRIANFTIECEHGTVRETIKFDPEKKIVTFHYDNPQVTQ